MAITLTLVQHNTDEELWLKCLETYDEHAPVQQGGPLMLFLILQRIQDRSVLDVFEDDEKHGFLPTFGFPFLPVFESSQF